MTGFGRAEYKTSNLVFTAQVRSVNHRFLDIKVKLPRSEWVALDHRVRKIVSQKCSRGSVEVSVSVAPLGSKHAAAQSLQLDTVDAFIQQIDHWKKQKRKKRTWLKETVQLDTLLRMPGVFGNTVTSVLDQFTDEAKLLECLVEPALEELQKSRTSEGSALQKHIRSLLDQLRIQLQAIIKLEPLEQSRVRDSLAERIKATLELLGKTNVSDDFAKRLNEEAAFWIDRRGTEEERVRFEAHLVAFENTLQKETGPKGRKLEFLQQELHREINTLGNKTQNAEIAEHVLTIKSLLENLKEQLANVE